MTTANVSTFELQINVLTQAITGLGNVTEFVEQHSLTRWKLNSTRAGTFFDLVKRLVEVEDELTCGQQCLGVTQTVTGWSYFKPDMTCDCLILPTQICTKFVGNQVTHAELETSVSHVLYTRTANVTLLVDCSGNATQNKT